MSRKWIAALLVVVIAFAAMPALGEAGDTLNLIVPGEFDTGLARSMLGLINDMRTGDDAWYWNESDTEKLSITGLQALRYDYGLEKVAMQRAAELAVYYAHTRPDGTTAFSAYPSSLAMGWIGENIAYGYAGTQSVFTAWAEADEPYSGQGHRRNMLGERFVSVGIGCFKSNGTLFWVQEFSSGTSGDREGVLPTPVTVSTLASSITDLAGSEEKLPLLLNQSVPLSDIDLTVTHASGRRVNCGIEGISWSSDNAAVALISNGSLRGVTPGKAVLTGRIGALSVKLPIKVVEKLEAFDVSVTGKQRFDGGYALLTIDIPELEGAKSYSMMQHSLENSSSRYYSCDGPGRYSIYVWRVDDVMPVHFTFDVNAFDEDGIVIGRCSRNYVVYQDAGVLGLPTDLNRLGAEAFAGASFYSAVLPAGCAAIESRAFADCANLYSVCIPDSVTFIAEDAFDGCADDMIVVASADSAAAKFAADKGYAWFELD